MKPLGGGYPFGMNLVERTLSQVDSMQRRNRTTAFTVAVVKKFGDDRGASLAALLTYYGFLSIFPLLLILTTILGFVGNEDVSDSVIGTTLQQFPVFGEQIGRSVDRPLTGSTVGLVIGLLVLLYGALGVAQAAQHAMAQVWNVPGVVRPGFGPRLGRGLLFFCTLGLGMVGGAVLSALTTGSANGLVLRAVALVAVVLLNVVLFTVVFRLLTPKVIETSTLLPGSIAGGVGYTVLLGVGTALVQYQLRGAGAVYGQFATVLGLLAWLFIVSQLALYAAEANVVLARRLWPRSIAGSLTPADEQVLRDLVHQEERRPEQRVGVGFEPNAALGAAADAGRGRATQ
jgi:YihY family inner membrane protein